MRTITITLHVPDGCDVHVSTDAAQPITTGPALSTRPDATPCSCRGECHRPGDWFADQERRERLHRRRGTIMEGRPDA